MGSEALAPGSARLHVVGGVPLLRPDAQVFDAMLDGWRNQQLARNLAFGTIEARGNAVRAFSLMTTTGSQTGVDDLGIATT